MPKQAPSALLVDLEPEIASELEQMLSRMGHSAVRSGMTDVPVMARKHEVIFCSDQQSNVNSLIQLLRTLRTQVRVIVASRKADETAWLEALEAGADDYCSTPFEAAQLSWAMHQNPAMASR